MDIERYAKSFKNLECKISHASEKSLLSYGILPILHIHLLSDLMVALKDI